MADFGKSFKAAREAKGVSLRKIADETRISTRFLLAIEDEEFHLLPGGIFNRGFIRTYAERVGLDPDQAVADYERLAGSELEDSLETGHKETERSERHFYLATVGALVLLIAIFYIVTTNIGTTVELAREQTQAVPESAAPEPVAPPPTPAPEESLVSQEPALPTEEAETMSLEMEVHEPTWIQLTTDGNQVSEGILAAGTSRHYTAQESIDIRIGNAGGLTLKVNGHEVRMLGSSGQVRQIIITPETLGTLLASQ